MARFWSLLEQRSLLAKLLAGFAILLLSILLLGINSIVAARDMNWQAAKLYRMELLGLSHIKEANIGLMATGRALRQMVLAPTFVDRDEARAQLDRAMLDLQAEIDAARQSIFREQERLLLNKFEAEFEHYKRNVNDAIALINRSIDYQQKATAYVSGEQFNQVGDSADQLLHRMAALKEERARETAVAIARHSRDMQWLTAKLLLGGLLVGTITAVWIARSIRRPSNRLRQTDDLAQENVGDIVATVDYRNEHGAEEQSLAVQARQAEFTEACQTVESIPDDRMQAEEPSEIISPEHSGDICGEERPREHVEPIDEPYIAPTARVSILIVADNESNHEAVIGSLTNSDCKVAIAHSGQEALELLEKSPYDVVLMNMQMAMDGISATSEIRRSLAFESLPIIAMTGSGIYQDRQSCLAAGINGHIAKPIDPDQLQRALMRWISSTPNIRATIQA